MSELILLRMHRRNVEAAEEAWQAAHREAMVVGDVDRILGLSAALPEGLRQAWLSAYEQIRGGQLAELNSIRTNLQRSFEATARILRNLRDWGEELEQSGHELQNLSALAQALRDTEQLQELVFSHWSEFTQDDLNEGITEATTGHGSDLDAGFAQIAGVDTATWLQRVDEHTSRMSR